MSSRLVLDVNNNLTEVDAKDNNNAIGYLDDSRPLCGYASIPRY